MALRARIEKPDFALVDSNITYAEQRIMFAARRATDIEARKVALEVRSQMAATKLGRMGNAIGSSSDLTKNRYHRTPRGFSVSGNVHIRSRSERSVGAIISYTEGAEITPRNGRWLWIATDEIPKFAGKERMTPALYRKMGFEQRIGPLVVVKSINGNPLLVAKNISVSEGGKSRSARALTKSGRPRKGQRAKEFVVAFIGIPRTSRAARVSVSAIMQQALDRLPNTFETELRKELR